MALTLQLLLLTCLIVGYIFLTDLFMKGIKKASKLPNNTNPYMNVFNNVLLFTLSLVTITAIVCTKGKSIYVLVLPLLVIYFIYNKKKVRVTEINVKKNPGILFWLNIILITLITVLLSFFVVLKFSMRNDVSHYVKISQFLINEGIENPFHYYNNDNSIFKGNAPYHYFEMWFGGLCFKISNFLGIKSLSNYIIYIYFVFNLFRVLAVIGIFGLITKFVKFGFILYLIVFLFLIIDISAFCNWGNDAYVAESNFFERPNFIFYYTFLVPIFHSVLNTNKESLIFWSSVFCISTVTVIPALASTIYIVILYYYIKEKSGTKKNIILIGLFSLLLLLYGLFYSLFGASKDASLVESMSLDQLIYKTLSIWKACLFMFSMLFFKIIIIIALSILVIKKQICDNNYKPFKKLYLFICLICLFGIGIFQLVPYLDNMYQFSFLGYCAVLMLLILVVSIKMLYLKGFKLYIGFALFFVLILYGFKRNIYFDHILIAKPKWNFNIQKNFLLQNNFSLSFIENIQYCAPFFYSANGVSIIDSADVKSQFMGLRHSATYQLGNFLMVLSNNIHLPLVSDPNTLYPDTNKSNKDFYKANNFNSKTSFYRYYNNNISYKQNLLKYIEFNNVNYVVASSHFKTFYYFDTVKVKRIIKDKNTGYQLILFKNAK